MPAHAADENAGGSRQSSDQEEHTINAISVSFQDSIQISGLNKAAVARGPRIYNRLCIDIWYSSRQLHPQARVENDVIQSKSDGGSKRLGKNHESHGGR